MKNTANKFLFSILLALGFISLRAQLLNGHELTKPGKLPALEIRVTYEKTTHLIFPSAIRYVDLGSNFLVAGKAEQAENVLRIKASQRDFPEETNFSVITEDGKFYCFDVSYEPDPEVLSIDISALLRFQQRNQVSDVLFEDLGSQPPSLIGLILETLYKKDKAHIQHISAKSFGIVFMLKGLYIHEGNFYFHTQLQNETQVPFYIDFVSFRIVDKRSGKRTVIQEKLIKPKRVYKSLDPVMGKTTAKNIFLLEQFTLSEGKVLLIEVFEKNGGRHQVLEIGNANLIRAKLIRDMHLKIN